MVIVAVTVDMRSSTAEPAKTRQVLSQAWWSNPVAAALRRLKNEDSEFHKFRNQPP